RSKLLPLSPSPATVLSARFPSDSRLIRHLRTPRDDRGLLLLRGWWRRLGLRRGWLLAFRSSWPRRYRSAFLRGEFFAELPRPGAETLWLLCPTEVMDSLRAPPSNESGSRATRPWLGRRGGGWRRGTRASGLVEVVRPSRRTEWRRCLCRSQRRACVLTANWLWCSGLPRLRRRDGTSLESCPAGLQCARRDGCWSRIRRRRERWSRSV